MTTTIIVIRYPDVSNEYAYVIDGVRHHSPPSDVEVVDVDLGRIDMRATGELAEWAAGLRAESNELTDPEGRQLLREIIREQIAYNR